MSLKSKSFFTVAAGDQKREMGRGDVNLREERERDDEVYFEGDCLLLKAVSKSRSYRMVLSVQIWLWTLWLD